MFKLAKQFVSEPLMAQQVRGYVKIRFWAQTLDPTSPSTWAVTIRIVSRDGETTRGTLLPMNTGHLVAEKFDSNLKPYVIGPFDLNPLDAEKGDRIVAELGSLGVARIVAGDSKNSWIEFSHELTFESVPEGISQSRFVGQCIYCLHSESSVGDISLLSREHIIPTGLNGEQVLQKASCGTHRDITSRLELEVLRTALQAPRAALNMRTGKRPTHLPLVVERKGKQEIVNVPLAEYPSIIATPRFAPPAHLSGVSYTSGINIINADTCQVSGLSLEELCRKYSADYVAVRLSYRVTDFARMIAKIAYGYAVLVLGLPRIAECYVLPSIRGDIDDVGRWVGCDNAEPMGPNTGLHSLTLRVIDGGEVHVYVRLFAQFNHREYVVVVGRFA